ncbi:Methyltransferase TM1293 [Desulfurella amilsii]|uniref:Methyltransferase TM1293 n=1 Tax=Desulfurella amilsii TaxID=1562698 RepID=A0A1X4XVR8_9BACT|nr:class I SAM-dependent methyltransferase [Desulfurella amilsii]OSS41608.1 Methyltransferase TM1293 [Desulfurella amilsii]
MKKAVISINENGDIFDGNFEDSPFYLIVEGDQKKKIQDCALDINKLGDSVLIGKSVSVEFKNIITSKSIEYIFLDFVNAVEVLEYFKNYSDKIQVFDNNTEDYEEWFEKNKYVYLSEVEALKKVMPKEGKGIEIGVGSGRFALPLGIKVGVEPSKQMADIAKKNGIDVIFGVAESLPLEDNSFDFALMAVTICFVNDPLKSLKECYRILKPKGKIIIGIVDSDTTLGRLYLEKKENSVFYKHARFFSSKQVIDLLEKSGFTFKQAYQVLLGDYRQINAVEEPKEGFGEGGFSVLVGEK